MSGLVMIDNHIKLPTRERYYWRNSSFPPGLPSFRGPRSTPGLPGILALVSISCWATRFSAYAVWFTSRTPDSQSFEKAYPVFRLSSPSVLTGNLYRSSSKNLMQSSFFPDTMMSSTCTPTINTTLPSINLWKTHESALHCSRPIA